MPRSLALPRLGVIEVGSGAIRLLVADVTADRLTNIVNRSEPLQLLGERQDQGLIAEIAYLVANFRETAIWEGANVIVLFGTEAVRRLQTSGAVSNTTFGVPMDVLSPHEEARCSALAARLALTLRPGSHFVMVDQGRGSMELSISPSEAPYDVGKTATLPLGTDVLLTEFRRSGRELREIISLVEHQVADGVPAFADAVWVAQGSIATRFAWRSLGPSGQRAYSPTRVHGSRQERSDIEACVSSFARLPYVQWVDHLSEFCAAEAGPEDLDRFVVGAVALAAVMRRAAITSYVVSGLGTRHGVALRYGLRLGGLVAEA